MRPNSIAVIVTIKNDALGLTTLRQDLAAQTLQPNEIIITAVQSEDGTEQAAQIWADQDPRVVVEIMGSATRSEGRNRAIELSQAEIIACTDAGCRLDPQWLEFLTQPFTHQEIELVSGLTLGAPQSEWERAQVPYVLVAPDKIGDHPLPATRNLAVRRSAFQQIGPFRPDLNWAEDFEWSRRAVSKGITPHFVSQAVVYWRPRQTSGQFWRMMHSLALGDIQAQTWRAGHFTMLGRYAVFFLVLAVLPSAGITLWLMYLFAKSRWTSWRAGTTWAWTFWAQLLADSAVGSGTLRGMWTRLRQGKRT